MSALPSFSAAHEPVTRDILHCLIEQTMLARSVVTDGDALETVLARRSALVESLAHSVQALAGASAHPVRTGADAELVELSEKLQHQNAALLQRVRTERERVMAALSDLSHPDPVGSRYGSDALQSTHLNLVR
jgi:hypothetical protein